MKVSHSLTGFGQLLRLALRRDRLKVPLWSLVIVGLAAASTPALTSLYDTPAKLQQYAATTSSSVVAKLFGGPIDGPDIGSVMMVEYFLVLAIAVAFLSTLTVVRHTRQNEEAGRSELMGSMITGRHAALAAALTMAVLTNVCVSAVLFGVLRAGGLPQEGSLLMALGVGGVGLVFAGVAAITSQISEAARTANSQAAMVIGAAFILRALGDALGPVAANGLQSTSLWPSWLSPIGWGQQLHPFTQGTWWPLLLFVVAFVGLSALAFYLSTKRDVGLGLVASRSGPPTASPLLSSPLGLAWRLQRGVLIGWTVSIVIFGSMLGVAAVEFRDFLTQNNDYLKILEDLGAASSDPTDVYFAGTLSMLGILIAAYVVQSLGRLRSEETEGPLELILANPVSRLQWLRSHVVCTFAGGVWLLLLGGFTSGVSYLISADESWQVVHRLVGAILVHGPAALLLLGVFLVAFGKLPRLALTIAWAVFGASLLIFQLGPTLQLPNWAINLAPFSHTPSAPAASISFTPLIWLSGIGIALALAGIYLFRQRDITN